MVITQAGKERACLVLFLSIAVFCVSCLDECWGVLQKSGKSEFQMASTLHNLFDYCLYTSVLIFCQCGADNRYMQIIGHLHYICTSSFSRKLSAHTFLPQTKLTITTERLLSLYCTTKDRCIWSLSGSAVLIHSLCTKDMSTHESMTHDHKPRMRISAVFEHTAHLFVLFNVFYSEIA